MFAESYFNQALSFNVASVTNFHNMFASVVSLDDCNKALINTAFSSNTYWTSNYGTWASYGCPPLPPAYPPPVAPPPPTGAIIEMTGDIPKIVFGDLAAPVCAAASLACNKYLRNRNSSCPYSGMSNVL